jgi:hypothetical protein
MAQAEQMDMRERLCGTRGGVPSLAAKRRANVKAGHDGPAVGQRDEMRRCRCGCMALVASQIGSSREAACATKGGVSSIGS